MSYDRFVKIKRGFHTENIHQAGQVYIRSYKINSISAIFDLLQYKTKSRRAPIPRSTSRAHYMYTSCPCCVIASDNYYV